jgi:hypothetical protein
VLVPGFPATVIDPVPAVVILLAVGDTAPPLLPVKVSTTVEGTGGTGGDYRTPGMGGGTGFGIGTTGPQVSAIGGSSQLGSGGFPVSGTAVAGLGHGAGGGGGTTNSGAIAGAAGSAGLVVVQEFILS